jgi:Uma2 family endonuclease
MPLAPDYFTADMVRALPEDGNRYEVVRGELLVSPAPRVLHQLLHSRLFLDLGIYCRDHGLGRVMSSPADISWSPDSLVQPDLFVVPPAFTATRRWSDIRSLSLVVEILSPSTAKHDRFQKRKYYQENGVPMLWIVDGEKRCVEVWTPDALFPQVETSRLTWHPDERVAPFELDLSTLFAP